MRYVGFQHNYSAKTDPRTRWSPSLINRVALVESRLRPAGFRLFLYSPRDIQPTDDTVPGLLFDEGRFVRTESRIPGVNGNWTHRTRRLLDRGMGYQEMGRWAAERGIGIFVPHVFSELLGNKFETYKMVRAYHETLHPLCELYVHSGRQLEYFLDTGGLAFIKPRTGSKGNRIVTIRRDRTGLTVTRYFHGRQRQKRATTLRDVLAFIGEVTRGRRRYVIQHGVETVRRDRSTFDIRVTMLNDGVAWHWLHEARVSPPASDVSNVSQGGEIRPTEPLLLELMGPESSQELLHQLRSESFGLATYLERLHPGDILEVAFDFAIDRTGTVRLLEINTKPGLAGIGSDVSIYQKRPEHEPLFERWVYPHTRYLSEFLLRKCQGTFS